MEAVYYLLDDVQNLSGTFTGGDKALLRKLQDHEIYNFLDAFRLHLLTSVEEGCWRKFSPVVPRLETEHETRVLKGLTHFLQGLRDLVFDRATGQVLPFPSPDAFRHLYQVSSFFDKMGSAQVTDDMKRRALSQYIFDEEKVQSLDLSGCDELLEISRDLVERYILKSYIKPNSFRGRHGPGAVSEGNLLPWEKYTVFNPHEDLDIYWPHIRLERGAPAVSSAEPSGSRTSRLCFVPKNRRKCRIICAEPALLQYLQQGERFPLYQAIETSSLDIDLRDQTRNARVALESSDHGYYATLDLRSASDLLSSELVGCIFPTPMFARFMACRSHHTSVIVDDVSQNIQLSKFGSMGNALTFPVQSIVFWGLVSATLIQSGMRERDATTNVWVYGDDIICPSSYVRGVFQNLEAVGLSPNKEKSFWKGPFRESCGIHAFAGKDVTPIYLRSLDTDPESLVSICATARGLQSLGYVAISEYLYGYIEKAARVRLPFSPRVEGMTRWVHEEAGVGEVIQLNLAAGIRVKRNRYHHPVVSTKGIKPEKEIKAVFSTAWDMWDFVGPHGNIHERDRGVIARGKRLAHLDVPLELNLY